jgi:endonuclease III
MSSQPVQQGEETIRANRQRVAEILRRLDHQWTPQAWAPSKRPVDELVGTILSQNTSDTNTHRAFTSLRNAYPCWRDVVAAPEGDVVEAIRSGGLAVQKAPRIQRVLAEILESADGDPNESLQARLSRMDSDDAMEWLTRFSGVGPKTAACVLLFAVGKSIVPVDTHVYRVSRRIGLVGERTSADGAHRELLPLVPSEDAYRFHVHLIRHGRTVCKARSPACNDCTLRELCDYGRLNSS